MGQLTDAGWRVNKSQRERRVQQTVVFGLAGCGGNQPESLELGHDPIDCAFCAELCEVRRNLG